MQPLRPAGVRKCPRQTERSKPAAVTADTAAEADPVAAIERAYARLLQLYPQIAPRTHGEAA